MSEDTSFNRRGNQALRRDVQEARRIYDPEVEMEWGLKYRNFSGDHMRGAYKVYAEARHDPFNKAPTWIDSVMKKGMKSFAEQGVTVQEEFTRRDQSGNGLLERQEVRRMMLELVPTIGDMEVQAIFDHLDANHDNEVSLNELAKLFVVKPSRSSVGNRSSRGNASGSNRKLKSGDVSVGAVPPSTGQSVVSDVDSGHHHRSPVHRVKRFPPSQIDGYDHLFENAKFKQEADLLQHRDSAMFQRIGAELCLSPRKHADPIGSSQKYSNFGGGADSGRFHLQHWRNNRNKCNQDTNASSTIQSTAGTTIPDPGGIDIKPGYHIELERLAPHLVPLSTRVLQIPHSRIVEDSARYACGMNSITH